MKKCTKSVRTLSLRLIKTYKEMKMNKTLVILTAITIGVFTSCVPGKKFDEMEAKEKACQSELTAIKVSNQQMEEKMKGLLFLYLKI